MIGILQTILCEQFEFVKFRHWEDVVRQMPR